MRYGLPKFFDFWDPSAPDQDPLSRDSYPSARDDVETWLTTGHVHADMAPTWNVTCPARAQG